MFNNLSKFYTLILAFTVIAACAPKQKDPTPLPSVFVKKVEVKPLSDLLSYPAWVSSRVNASVLSESDGIVTDVPVHLGKRVQAHQTLMVLHHTDPIYRYAPVKVVSPIDGIVSSIDVTRGSHVTTGQKLASVINPRDLEIQVQIPAQDLPAIHQKMEGEFKIPGREGILLVWVIGISPFVDPTTGTALAQLRVRSKSELILSPGLQGQVSFKANLHQGISISESAVIYRGKEAFVRIVESGKIKQLQVELGAKQRGEVEIKRGLKGGESLVERVSRFVADGELVKVQ